MERARAAYESQMYPAAAVQFEQALTACPNPDRILLPLAKAQLMAGRVEPSRATIDRLLRIDQRNVEALKLLGDVLYLLGKEPEAEQALVSALKLSPQHEPSQYALARIYYQQNRIDAAAALLREILARQPDHYRAHDNLALCYAALRRDSEALRHFFAALNLVHKAHPEYDVVYANLASFFLDRDEYQKAFQLGAEAAKRNPRSARNFFLTGKALVKLEKHELSVRWLKQAADIEPSYAEPRYLLAQVYRKLGRNDEANLELEKFRALSKAPKMRR